MTDTMPIGAFYFNDIITARAITRVATRHRLRIVGLLTPNVLRFLGPSHAASLCSSMREEGREFVQIQMDHAMTLEDVQAALAVGVDGVMIDGGILPLDENIRLTRRVCAVLRDAGCWAEGQIGTIAGTDYRTGLTAAHKIPTASVVQQFWENTQVEYLSVAVGNTHTYQAGEDCSKIDETLIKESSQLMDASLVLHGADTLPDSTIRRAVASGIEKVNFGPVLKHAYLDRLAWQLSEPYRESQLRQIFENAGAAVERVIEMKVLTTINSGDTGAEATP